MGSFNPVVTFEHAEEILDPPSLEIVADDLGGVLGGPDVERGQQPPLRRGLSVGRGGLDDMHRGHGRRLGSRDRIRCRQGHAADAQLAAGQPLAAGGAGLPSARLGAGRQPVDLDVDQAVRRAVGHHGEQFRPARAERPVVPRPDQQIHPRTAPLRVEHLEAVRLPVAHRDHAGAAADFADRLGGVGEAVQPPPGPPPLHGLRRAGLRRIEAQPQDAERKARLRHRQRRVQVQPEALRAGPVRADHLEPLAARTGREVQAGPVLDRQNRALAADPADAALAVRREDGPHLDRRVRRHLDQPVERVDRRAVARAVRVDLAARNRPEKIGALRQPRRKTLVAQGSPSELVLRPLRRAQPLARLQGRRVLDMRHSESPAPAGVERTHEHRLRRLREPLGGVLAAASGRLADAQEAGGPQAAPVIARIDEALNQPRPEPVARLEIPGQPPQDAPEQVAGEMRAARRRADQEAAQADHPVEMLPPPLVAPRHPAVACRRPERGGGTPTGSSTPSGSRRGVRSTASAVGGGRTIPGSSPASVESAFRHPDT